MTAVNRLLAHPDDKPTMGNSTQPISVAEWKTHLTRTLPNELQTCLPSIEEIQAELAGSN